jgi:hypothetical protein
MRVKVSFIAELPGFQPEMSGKCIEAQAEEYLVDDDCWLRLLDEIKLSVEVLEPEDTDG